jgi:hypothetical protein
MSCYNVSDPSINKVVLRGSSPSARHMVKDSMVIWIN